MDTYAFSFAVFITNAQDSRYLVLFKGGGSMKKVIFILCLLLFAFAGFSYYYPVPSGNYGWALPSLSSPYYAARVPAYSYAGYYPSYGYGAPYYPSYGYGGYYSPYSYAASYPAYGYGYPAYSYYYPAPVRYVYAAPVVRYYPVAVYPSVPISYYPYGSYYPNLYGW